MAQTYSINVSGVREVLFAGRIVTTGIYKQPVHGKSQSESWVLPEMRRQI